MPQATVESIISTMLALTKSGKVTCPPELETEVKKTFGTTRRHNGLIYAINMLTPPRTGHIKVIVKKPRETHIPEEERYIDNIRRNAKTYADAVLDSGERIMTREEPKRSH